MGLRDISRQVKGAEKIDRESDSLRKAEDAFDAPMMIMNQIHEA